MIFEKYILRHRIVRYYTSLKEEFYILMEYITST